MPRHPIVEDEVVIYAGATVLGRITIGKGSIIGGNVWLTRSVPPGSSITQASSRQCRFGVETTVRPSFAFYNTCEEIDLFISVVGRLAHTRKN